MRIFIFVLFMAIGSPPVFADNGQWLIGGRATLNISNGVYASPSGNMKEYEATFARSSVPMPTCGTISDFKVTTLKGETGAGASWIFSFYKSGIVTDLIVTLSDSEETDVNESNSFHVCAPDEIAILVSSTGSPATNSVTWRWKFTPDIVGERILLGTSGQPGWSGDDGDIWQVDGNNSVSGELFDTTSNIFPINATIKKFYMKQDSLMDSGKYATNCFIIEGVLSSLCTTVNDTDLIDSDTSTLVSVSAGDIAGIQLDVPSLTVNQDRYLGWSAVYVPEDQRDFCFFFSNPNPPGGAFDNWTIAYQVVSGLNRWSIAPSGVLSAIETRQLSSVDMYVRAIYTWADSSPGVVGSYTFDLLGDGVDVGLETVMTEPETEASTTLSSPISVSSASLLVTRVVATNESDGKIFKVSYVARMDSDSNEYQNLTITNINLN